MVLEFHTKNLNKRLYQRLFDNLCLHTGWSPYIFNLIWKVRIVPLQGTNTDFFGHVNTTSGTRINPNIPSGNTGDHVITLWLNDTKNEFIDRSNHVVVMHEFCHARLFGNSNWVNGVHDKIDYQGRLLKSFPISFWYWKFPLWRKVRLNVIDIRDEI